MTIDNNDVQNQINSLSSDVKKLTNTVNSLSRTLADSTRASRTVIADVDKVISETFKNKLTSAIKESLSKAQDKSNTKLYTNKGELRANQYVKNLISKAVSSMDKSLEEQKVLLSTYNKDHKNNPEEDLTNVYEACKVLVPLIKEWGDNLNLSKDTIRDILQRAEISNTLNVTKSDKTTISEFRQIIRDEMGVITGVLNTGGPFAIPKEDAKKLGKELNKVSAQLKQTQDTIKLTNDVVLDLATNSDAVNKIMLDMNVNMEMANENLRIFNMLLTSTGNAQWQQETSIKNNVKAMGQMQSVMTQMQQSMTNLTRANERALKRLEGVGSPSGSKNSFREQATRNSDRAKQAGFIAMLIPALAKLLHKSPLTDTLRFLALKFGAGKSGMGEHPVLGTLGLYAAPVIGGLLATKILTNKALWNYVGKSLWNAPKGLTTPKGNIIRWSQVPKIKEGIKLGWKAPTNNSNTLAWYKDYNKISKIRYDGGNIVYKNGYIQSDPISGRLNQSRGFNIGYRGRQYLTKALPKMGTKFLGRVPWLAAGIEAFGELSSGKFGASYQKDGGKGLLYQTGKSAVGVGASLGGLALGAKGGAAIGTFIGGPIGTAIGLVAGAAIAGFLMPAFKNVSDAIFNNLGPNSPVTKTSDSILKLYNIQREEHPLISKLCDILVGFFQPIQPIIDWCEQHLPGGKNGSNNNAGGMPSNERNQMEHEINKQKKQSEEEQKKYKKDQKTFDELEKYASGGKSREGEKEYNRLIDKYAYEYASTKVRGTSGPVMYAKETWLDKFGHMVTGTSSLKQKHDAEIESLKTSQEAQQYAQQKLAEYRVNQKDSLIKREERLNNSVYVDPTQLVSSEFLKTHKQSEVSAVLAKNTGAYEALQNKKGYWNVGSTFYHDVKYAGRGTQNTLQSLVDQGYIPSGFTITSAMGARGDKDNKLGHSGEGHYRPQGNALDLVWGSDAIQKVAAEGGYYNGKYYKGMGAAKQAGLVKAFADERPGTAAYKWARGGSNLHTEVSNAIAGYNTKRAAEQVATQAAQATKTSTETEETASSEIRKDLAAIVGAKNKSDKQERARNVIFSAVDVTGSLGVWGITQLNNGQMRTGR